MSRRNVQKVNSSLFIKYFYKKDIKNDIKNQSMQSGYFIEKPAENKNNNNIDLFNEEDFIQSIVNKASRKGISAISREDITKLQGELKNIIRF